MSRFKGNALLISKRRVVPNQILSKNRESSSVKKQGINLPHLVKERHTEIQSNYSALALLS